MRFALEAVDRVTQCSLDLELRYTDGSPLRMGWAVAMGHLVVRLMPGALVTALGDVLNVGFRLAGLAGRQGRPHLLATSAVREAAQLDYDFTAPEEVSVKGRIGTESVLGVVKKDPL